MTNVPDIKLMNFKTPLHMKKQFQQICNAKNIDLPPEAPSFITRVCGFGFHILRRQFEQARRVRSPQIAEALGALQRVFGCPEMSAV